MAPGMFTLISAQSQQPVQGSHQSLVIVVVCSRWDFAPSAQGNGVDVLPRAPAGEGVSFSISNSVSTTPLFHMHMDPDFGRAGGLKPRSWFALGVWPVYTTPGPIQHVSGNHQFPG